MTVKISEEDMADILIDLFFRHMITIFVILPSDELMYKAKAEFYKQGGTDRRAR